jgi:hypothetical protein
MKYDRETASTTGKKRSPESQNGRRAPIEVSKAAKLKKKEEGNYL